MHNANALGHLITALSRPASAELTAVSVSGYVALVNVFAWPVGNHGWHTFAGSEGVGARKDPFNKGQLKVLTDAKEPSLWIAPTEHESWARKVRKSYGGTTTKRQIELVGFNNWGVMPLRPRQVLNPPEMVPAR